MQATSPEKRAKLIAICSGLLVATVLSGYFWHETKQGVLLAISALSFIAFCVTSQDAVK